MPTETGPESSGNDLPLPQNIHLLSSQEILDLVTSHKSQLELYVAQFDRQDESKTEVLGLKTRLEELEQEFRSLDDRRNHLQGKLEENRILESQYVKMWQDLHQRIDQKYSEDLMKAKLEIQMRELEDASVKMENQLGSSDKLDSFLQQYIDLRTEYHVKREQLGTWNAQGELKIR
ncbi:hypothetical protein HG536_0C01390 [Torulaspora globosa]|uniref:VPS37 C-terminal domain-containing protein n=1 Tax=Torulaspora globosa TaxID=48254 RepID=A0A7G3ZEN5_9SACH|nr:uncharacterized protein HG536_0C01390 [Torulaspora globosa]QLL31971.1 hypothetical protein HG536_0C01390 [Torulaspora globosa]